MDGNWGVPPLIVLIYFEVLTFATKNQTKLIELARLCPPVVVVVVDVLVVVVVVVVVVVSGRHVEDFNVG